MEETIYSNFVSFDSEDRDMTKYPAANQWSMQLPENYKNIKSISLFDSAIPYKNIYNIHHNYQNNAFIVTKPTSSPTETTISFDEFNTDTFITKKNLKLQLPRPLEPYLHTTQPKGKNVCISTTNNTNSCDKKYNNIGNNKCSTIAYNYQDWALKRVRGDILVKDPNKFNNKYPYYPEYNETINFTDFTLDNNGEINTFLKNGKTYYLVLIPNGTYDITEMVTQLTSSLQQAQIPDITVHPNLSTKSIYFESTEDYSFEFDTKIIYPNCSQNSVFDYNSFWGLGYHLGFNKKKYTFSTYKKMIGKTFISANLTEKYIIPKKSVRLTTPTVIYMEIDKYNSICEYRNKYNKISAEQNSAFAKIFIGSDEHFNGNNINSIEYTTVCKNKLFDRISNFNFKFRFHNGILVEFIDNFNFTLKLDEVLL